MSRRGLALEPVSPFESGTWGTPERPCPSVRTLAAHVDGELAAGAARLVEGHLDACGVCASDARRLEGLSHCLRAWARDGGTAEPPPRLLSRVLRSVAPEGAAIRRETVRARRTTLLAVAAVALAWLGGGLLAWSERASPPSEVGVAPRADVGIRVPEGDGPVAAVGRSALAFVGDLTTASGAVPPPPLALVEAWARLDERPEMAALPPPSAEGEAWLQTALARTRSGAAGLPGALAVVDGASVGDASAAGASSPGSVSPAAEAASSLARAKARWLEDRRRWLADPRTADPATAGVSVQELFRATPVDAESTVVEPASRAAGGVVLRTIRGPVTQGPAPYDLAQAVVAGRARLLPDAPGDDATSVAIEVGPGARPILLLAGELFAGGVADRVLVAPVELVPAATPYTVRVRTRALAPPSPLVGGDRVPRALGLVAGPELRALLARDDDAATLAALVRAQLLGAGLVGAEGSAFPGLLALYRDEAGPRAARAAEAIRLLGDDVVGFLVTDPDGRFQGLERVELPAAVRAHMLARLLDGYLAEARARSMADAPRRGLRGLDVTASLERRASRLRREGGMEPFAGLVFVAPSHDDAARVRALSVLMPDYDR